MSKIMPEHLARAAIVYMQRSTAYKSSTTWRASGGSMA